MSGVNKVTLIGNLGADPDVRQTGGGTTVANFRVACTEAWKDKDGNKQERTEWVRVVAWDRLGELARDYLSKGRQVYIEGRLQTRKWENREGVTQFTTEVIARQFTFLGSAGNRKPTQEEIPPPSGDEEMVPY